MKWVSNTIISAGAILLLITGVCLAVTRDNPASAGVLLGFGFLFVVLLLLAKFKRFKGFGFEAETWEEKQQEAAALVESLKRLQLVYSKAVFAVVADPDVALGGKDRFARNDAIKQFVIQEAEKSGLNQNQIREILYSEKDSVSSEYAAAVYYYAHKALNGSDPNALQSALNPIMDSHPTPDQLEKILNDCKIDDAETRSFIDDYRYYLKTGSQRRPAVWAGRRQWMTRYHGFDKGWW